MQASDHTGILVCYFWCRILTENDENSLLSIFSLPNPNVLGILCWKNKLVYIYHSLNYFPDPAIFGKFNEPDLSRLNEHTYTTTNESYVTNNLKQVYKRITHISCEVNLIFTRF